MEGSSEDGDDSASSSSLTTPMGRWPPCSSTRHASKEWLRPSKEVCTPLFGFQGQLKQPMDNRKVGAPVVLNADMDQLMESGSPACCHTTVQQRARSFQDALEMLHLTGETGDSELSLRDARRATQR